MTWKLVYKLYVAYLVTCVNFIEIDQVVLEYSQLTVSKAIKSRRK